MQLVISLFNPNASCSDILLGKDEDNNPENVFELFWTDFDQHYSLFEMYLKEKYGIE